jgi:hypothetical protein
VIDPLSSPAFEQIIELLREADGEAYCVALCRRICADYQSQACASSEASVRWQTRPWTQTARADIGRDGRAVVYSGTVACLNVSMTII